MTKFYHTFFLLMSLLENATLKWGQSWERVVPIAKLDNLEFLINEFSMNICYDFFSNWQTFISKILLLQSFTW